MRNRIEFVVGVVGAAACAGGLFALAEDASATAESQRAQIEAASTGTLAVFIVALTLALVGLDGLLRGRR